jgi:hypothetical protein
MKRFLQMFAAILAGLLIVSGTCWAQSPPKPKLVTAKVTVHADPAGGTMVKKTPVASKDDIVRLQKDEAAHTETAAATHAAETPAAVGYTREEIETVQQEIKDKQKKVELLMRMFNADERPFLDDPSGQTGDSDATAKRRFEQEELRKTAEEVAALRAKLELMTANQVKVAAKE